MNLYWQYAKQRLVASASNGYPVNGLKWYARDIVPVTLTLVTGEGNGMAAGTLPSGYEIRFALKPKSNLSGDPIAAQATWTAGTSTHTAEIDLNTAELIAAIGSNADLECVGEFCLENGDQEHRYTTQFTIMLKAPVNLDGSLSTSIASEFVVRSGVLYGYNPDTAKWHKLVLRGAAGSVRLGIEQTGVTLS